MAREGSIVDKLASYAQSRQTLAGGAQPRLRPTDIPLFKDMPTASVNPLMDDDETRQAGKNFLARTMLARKGIKDGPSAYPDGPTIETILGSGKPTKEYLKRLEKATEDELESDGPFEKAAPTEYGWRRNRKDNKA